MGTTQKNIFAGAGFLNAIESLFTAKQVKENAQLGYYRSGSYICPSAFYNHRSGTFAGNQRRQRKLGKKRRR